MTSLAKTVYDVSYSVVQHLANAVVRDLTNIQWQRELERQNQLIAEEDETHNNDETAVNTTLNTEVIEKVTKEECLRNSISDDNENQKSEINVESFNDEDLKEVCGDRLEKADEKFESADDPNKDGYATEELGDNIEGRECKKEVSKDICSLDCGIVQVSKIEVDKSLCKDNNDQSYKQKVASRQLSYTVASDKWSFDSISTKEIISVSDLQESKLNDFSDNLTKKINEKFKQYKDLKSNLAPLIEKPSDFKSTHGERNFIGRYKRFLRSPKTEHHKNFQKRSTLRISDESNSSILGQKSVVNSPRASSIKTYIFEENNQQLDTNPKAFQRSPRAQQHKLYQKSSVSRSTSGESNLSTRHRYFANSPRGSVIETTLFEENDQPSNIKQKPFPRSPKSKQSLFFQNQLSRSTSGESSISIGQKSIAKSTRGSFTDSVLYEENYQHSSAPTTVEDSMENNANHVKLPLEFKEHTEILENFSDTSSCYDELWIEKELSKVIGADGTVSESCQCYKDHGCLQVVEWDELVLHDEIHSVETGSVSDWLYTAPHAVCLQPTSDFTSDCSKPLQSLQEQDTPTHLHQGHGNDVETVARNLFVNQWVDDTQQYCSTHSPTFGCGDNMFFTD